MPTTSKNISRQGIVTHVLVGLIGSMIIIATLFFAAANPSQDIQPGKVFNAIRSSSLTLFVLFISTALIGIWFRAMRYRILIESTGEPRENIPDMKQMFIITSVRGMVVDLLPARLGELIYVALLKKFTNTSIPAGLTSLVFAMLLDIAILVPITVVLAFIIGFPTAAPLKIAIVAGVVVLGFYIGIRFILPVIARYFERFSQSGNKIIATLYSLFDQLNQAIETALKAGILLKVLIITVFVRILKYMGLLILFYGLTSASFPDLAVISQFKVLSAMIASEMTAALPIPTLMSFGAWEIGGMTFLSYFGAPPQDSLLALIALHIQTQSVDYGIGVVSLFLLFLSSNTTDSSQQSGRSRTKLVLVISTLIALFAMTFSWYWFKEKSAQQMQASTLASIPEEQRPAWLQDLEGYVVWSSSRSGNHDIMIMDLSDQSIRPLTTHPHTETHPRISPDGTKVAFIRSIKKWQSWRAQRPWNIWVMDINTGKEKRIVQTGTAPTWSKDGKTIYFQRTLGEVWSYDVESEKETRLFQKNTNGMPNEELLWPSISDDGRLAVSFKDRGTPTNIIADQSGKIDVISYGCQIIWSPRNDFAIYVISGEGGKQENQFNKYDPVTGQSTKWLDLPGELSHEYFPRLDASQQFLVFAASDGAHEPDIEDYEIFIWKTDTPNAEAQRLTFEKNNDSWPDVFIRN